MSMVAKPSKPDDIVVFSILREAQCDECGAELGPGALLKKEGETALCLSCADLAHLVFALISLDIKPFILDKAP
jgi:hypothetical protein